MSQPLPNPIETNNLADAFAQIDKAGRRWTAINWNTPGWRKNRYVSLYEVFHTSATNTITFDQAHTELLAPKITQAQLI